MQVTMKSKAKSAARQADLSWGLEIKKDYNKWQEENIVAEAKAIQQRKMFVQATDAQLAEVSMMLPMRPSWLCRVCVTAEVPLESCWHGRWGARPRLGCGP